MTSHPNGGSPDLWQGEGGVSSSFVMAHAVIPERKGVEVNMFLFHLQYFSVATSEEIFVGISNVLIVFEVYFR